MPMLRSVGVAGEGKGATGSALTSYLLFEPSFTMDLINLGMADTLARRGDVLRFTNTGVLYQGLGIENVRLIKDTY